MQVRRADVGGSGAETSPSTGLCLLTHNIGDLVARFNQQMPGLWAIGEFRNVARANQGNGVVYWTPMPCEADAEPKQELLMVMGDIPLSFAVLPKTMGKDIALILHGNMQPSSRARKWLGEAIIEMSLDPMGQPVDFFPGQRPESRSERQPETLTAIRVETVGPARSGCPGEDPPRAGRLRRTAQLAGRHSLWVHKNLLRPPRRTLPHQGSRSRQSGQRGHGGGKSRLGRAHLQILPAACPQPPYRRLALNRRWLPYRQRLHADQSLGGRVPLQLPVRGVEDFIRPGQAAPTITHWWKLKNGAVGVAEAFAYPPGLYGSQVNQLALTVDQLDREG